ncbi:hypothetical protein X943_000981 [Babesia divergens]|uniref:Uncharacterized protein n=1 Tax=Babesia divergens TaxID=32595 RepID=A0AAD9LDW8_BABDI|nr:hypothetical protein X943_000981 [Babesia divergens]
MSRFSHDDFDSLDDYGLYSLSDSLVDDYDDPFESLSVNGSVPTFDIGVNGSVDTLFSRIPNSDSNNISDDALKSMITDYYANTYINCSMYDKSIFYTLQAELLVKKQRYKEALGAALVAEEISGPSKVLDAIKMICMYQMNDDARFQELKERFASTGFSGLSSTLKQQAIGTIQVSNFIPEFLSCLERLKGSSQHS